MKKRLSGTTAHEQPTPTIYRIVGEHRADPARLLVLGVDGLYYALTLYEGRTRTMSIVPDEDWIVDFPTGPDKVDLTYSF